MLTYVYLCKINVVKLSPVLKCSSWQFSMMHRGNVVF